MSFNSFRKESIDPNLRPISPPPVRDAIEYFPRSTIVLSIAECLSSLPRREDQNSTQKSRSRTQQRPRGRVSKGNTASSSSRPNVWSTPKHGRNVSASSFQPPLSPIDTLASVAAQVDNPSLTERPSKRARSEVLPSPQQVSPYQFQYPSARPATSYLPPGTWGRNVEQAIDMAQGTPNIQNGTQFSTVEDHQKRVNDAELLLVFSRSSGLMSSRPWASHADTPEAHNRPEVNNEPMRNSIWNSPLPYAPKESNRNQSHARPPRPHGEIVPIATPSSRKPADTSSYNAPSLPFTQTHTPPDDNILSSRSGTTMVHGLQQAENIEIALGVDTAQRRLRAGHTGETNGLGLSNIGSAHLNSPQSLPSEHEDPRLLGAGSESLSKLAELASQNQNGDIIEHDQDKPDWIPVNGNEKSTQHQTGKPAAPVYEDALIAQVDEETKCARCNFFANSMTGETVDWLQCNGCQRWFHFACTDFSRKQIETIDKFFCIGCKKDHGPTTFVRKSTRNRANVDYSSLNEGVFSTADENYEHRYIKHFKEGGIKYLIPETFARMTPEDLTIEYFERLPNFSEPIVIPSSLNPRPSSSTTSSGAEEGSRFHVSEGAEESPHEQEVVADEGQDKMDMVIPEGLTIARVAELYGPEMPIEVIDVKSQEGDSTKKWTVQKWADYYESTGDRPIRNVISLEVSRTPFGRLIRRPRVVRDLDLQDSVWPESDTSRTPVTFYCLMSVADCYTDFHIDFGGSSVYYHILKGKKVFFFIPPTKQNLKKYEDWCISPAQNETFLPDQTKECYRVDLSAGDTMLIPSGWIHSVWTPENSLVIGGNFLTRLHLSMQMRIMEIEKNTKVPLKYRYPHFQKVQWYTVIKYLQLDPLPSSVYEQFLEGKQFPREKLIWTQHNKFGHNSDLGVENYHARYYSKTETEGWPDLVRYIFRTVLIHEDRLEGITQESRKAVMRSIPKGYGEPLDNARKFAMWVAWKRGNEDIPQWAHPDAVLPTKADEKPNKWSSTEARKVERRAAVPPRTSHRLGPKKVVCEPCREKKIACKHVEPQSPIGPSSTMVAVVIAKQPETDISAVSTPTSDKRRWGKACNECRKSKRRCIHDENGNVDPSKQNQPAVPRSSNKKRKSSIEESEQAEKRIKTELPPGDVVADSLHSALHQAQPSGLAIDAPTISNGSPSPVFHDPLPPIDSLQRSESATAGEVGPFEAPASDMATFNQGSVAVSPVQGHAQSIEHPAQAYVNDATDINNASVPLVNGHHSDYSPSAPPATSEEPALSLVNGAGVNGAAQTTRYSSRQSKSVDRFSNTQYGTPNPRRGEKLIKEKSSGSPDLTRSQQSLTPELSRLNVPRSKKRSPSQMAIMTSGTSPSTELTPEEDASLRMAMQLQQQEFGLRSRRTAS